MRKLVSLLSLAVSLTLLYSTPLFAQKESTAPLAEDTTIIDLNFDENLDSLLNLYYVGHSIGQNPEFWNSEADSLVPNFSDSVYVDRLKKIPTVVDLTYNSIVRRYIEVYTRQKRSSVEVMLGLSQYYFPIFDDIYDFYDVPNEMKYMSIIESALNPRAYSRTRAVGLWQFMYGTGKQYGLTINSLVDERRDPIKSTYAAARYVKDLYAIYGDWTLVIAAYNCGPGNVNKAIRRSGGKRNYWDIYYFLPKETRGHVPAFIAATYVMNYYREHNLKPAPVSFPIASDTIIITRNLHMAQVSEVLGVPLPLLHDMNPQFRTDIIPAGSSGKQVLRLPLEQTARFIDHEKEIYAYKDSIFFNPEKVVVNPTSVDSRGIEEPAPGNYAKLTYTVKSGDNLGFISTWYNVRTSDIRYWNNIRRNSIRAGQKLSIYVPRNKLSRYQDINKMTFAEKQNRVGKPITGQIDTTPAPLVTASSEYVLYTVKQGDTIWDIMKKYPGVTQAEIMRLNNMSNARELKAGQQIKIKPKS